MGRWHKVVVRELRPRSSARRRSRPCLNASGYFFTTTISGLSFAARLWTTSALPLTLALSLRARWTSSAGMMPASPVLSSVLPLPSISTVTLPSITCSSSWAPGCICQGAAAPGGNSTMLTTVSCTTSPWPSRSLRRICVSFGPAWACASAMFAMDGAATARPDSARNSRRMISIIPSHECDGECSSHVFGALRGRTPGRVGNSADRVQSVAERGRDLLGERQRAGEARRLDAEEVHDAREPVLGRPLDHEIRRRLPWTRQLRPDPAIVGHERAVRQPRPIVADALVESERTAGIDVVVLALDPFHVRPEAHAPGEVKRHVHPQPARHRHRIDEPREHRAAGEGEIIALGEHQPRHPFGRIALGGPRQALGAEPGTIDHCIETEPLRLAARERGVPAAGRSRLEALD